MSCKSVRPMLSAYIDGELTGGDMLMIRSHVNDCHECSGELSLLVQTKRLMIELPVAPEPSAALEAKLMAIHQRPKRVLRPIPFAFAGASLLIAAFVGLNLQTNSNQERDNAIRAEVARNSVFDMSSDGLSGASLVQYASFENR